MWREKSQQVSDAPGSSDHAEPSTSRACASPYVSPSSSRMRRVSPTDTSVPLSSRRRQVSPIQVPEVPESPVVPEAPLPPPTADAAEPVPPPKDEVVDVEPEAFGGVLIDLSLLPLYPDHIVRHIWDGEVVLVALLFLIYI